MWEALRSAVSEGVVVEDLVFPSENDGEQSTRPTREHRTASVAGGYSGRAQRVR